MLKACGLCSTIISYKLTFNLPNFNDRIPQGSGSRGVVGSYLAESLPNITGVAGSIIGPNSAGFGQKSGVFKESSTLETMKVNSGDYTGANNDLIFNASHSSSTYQDNAPVQQAATVVIFCIKY